MSLAIALMLWMRDRDFSRAHAAALLLVGVLANLLVFSDSETFHKRVDGLDVLYYAEGLSGTVSVLGNDRYRGVFVDGQNVSGTNPVLVAESKMLAHLSLLLADDPKTALTVGYGTGTTSGSMRQHGIAVDAVEIEEKIIEAAPFLSPVNHRSFEDPGLNIFMDDARNYIDVVDAKFDVIVTDVTNLTYKRNPYLYIGTFDSVYPHTTVWSFTQCPTHFVIVVGTPERTEVDLGEQDVDDLVAGAPIHCDDRPVLELSDMDQYMMIDVEPNLKLLLAFRRENLNQYFTMTDEQRHTLRRRFKEYQRNYRDHIRRYERMTRPDRD